MPPRHTYWTILFGNQPTAFRSAEREELLPTFKQIQAKHPDAVMMWFARGRLWKSPEEARDTLDRPRYDRPRSSEGGDWRSKPQSDRPPRDPGAPRPEWRDKVPGDRPKPVWQNRDDRPQGDRPRGPRPEWKDRPRGDRPPGPPPAWPKSRGDEGVKPRTDEGGKPPASARWPNKAGYGKASPKPRSGEGGAWQNRDDRPQGDRPRGPRPEWKDRPRGDRPPGPPHAWPKSRGHEGGKPRTDEGGKPPASARWPNKAGYGEAPPKPRSGEAAKAWQNRDDRPQGDRPRGPRPEWKDRPRGDLPPGPPPAWPKSRRDEGGKPRADGGGKAPASARWPNKAGYGEASPKRSGEGGAWQNRGPKPAWRDKPQGDRPLRDPRAPRPEWRDKPQGDRPTSKDPGKRGRDWRPGGAHKDPRDRFKVPRDVKRARFKQNLQRDRTTPRPPRKKKDEE